MNSDLYALVGNTQGDALAAIDALLRMAEPESDPEGLRILLLTCRALLARINKERKVA